VKASEKVQFSLIGSQQCTFHRAIDEPCALPLSPQGWLKMRIFTLGTAFHIFVAGNCRHFKFGMWVEHSKSQRTHDDLGITDFMIE